MLEPLNDGIVMKERTREERTPGGVIVPETATKPYAECVVIAVGPGRRLQDGSRAEIGLRPRDVVLVSRAHCTEVPIRYDAADVTGPFLFTREEAVVGVIERA